MFLGAYKESKLCTHSRNKDGAGNLFLLSHNPALDGTRHIFHVHNSLVKYNTANGALDTSSGITFFLVRAA